MCKYDQDINYSSSGTEFIKIFERYRLRSDSKLNCTSQGFFFAENVEFVCEESDSTQIAFIESLPRPPTPGSKSLRIWFLSNLVMRSGYILDALL